MKWSLNVVGSSTSRFSLSWSSVGYHGYKNPWVLKTSKVGSPEGEGREGERKIWVSICRWGRGERGGIHGVNLGLTLLSNWAVNLGPRTPKEGILCDVNRNVRWGILKMKKSEEEGERGKFEGVVFCCFLSFTAAEAIWRERLVRVKFFLGNCFVALQVSHVMLHDPVLPHPLYYSF